MSQAKTFQPLQERGAALAWKVLEYIEANPEQHDQDTWLELPWEWRQELVDSNQNDLPVIDAPAIQQHCGTTACFAGWTVLLAGHKINVYALDEDNERVEDVAIELLGLEALQANRLFHSAQDVDDLREFMIGIFGPRA